MRSLLVFLFACSHTFLFSQTVVIQPAFDEGKDAMIDTTVTLDSASYYQNRGSMPVASVGVSLCFPDGFSVLCRARLLIQFPLEALGGDTAFLSALLTMYTTSVVLNSVTYKNEFNIKRVVSGWNENTVLWMTQPQVDTGVAAHFSVSNTTSDSIVVDVSEILRRSLADSISSHGFLVDFDVWGKDGYIRIHTSESADSLKHPKLTVHYNTVNTLPEHQATTLFFAYPSPAHDKLTIQYNGKDDAEVTLLSLDGRVQLRQAVNSKANNVIDVSALANGLYILHAMHKTEGMVIKRIVVAH